MVEIVARAGEGAGEHVVAEEEATSEAIHMAATRAATARTRRPPRPRPWLWPPRAEEGSR